MKNKELFIVDNEQTRTMLLLLMIQTVNYKKKCSEKTPVVAWSKRCKIIMNAQLMAIFK